jgi:hypothetical protein
MITCGIEMSGSEARLVLLSGTKSSFRHVDVEPRKLILADDENADEVKAFRNSLFAFFRENNVALVAIKKRGKRGDYAGGSVSFKIEGIAQLYEGCPVQLVPAQTIAAAHRMHVPSTPTTLTKYQHAAFKTAFGVLR